MKTPETRQITRQRLAILRAKPICILLPGVAFSAYWRRSGNLLVPAAVHAFIDAFRNVVT